MPSIDYPYRTPSIDYKPPLATNTDHNSLFNTTNGHRWPLVTTTDYHPPPATTTNHECPSQMTIADYNWPRVTIYADGGYNLDCFDWLTYIDWPLLTTPASLLTTGIQWPSIILHYLHTRLVNAVVNNRRRWSVALSVVIERKNPHTQYWPWPTFIYIWLLYNVAYTPRIF